MAGVELKNVSKIFDGKVQAVRDVSFSVNDQEFVTLLGPSGCGKTTVLRLIAGLEQPDSGKIFIDGKDVHDLSAARRDIAMVFQSYALYPHMSVAENILVSLKLRRVPKDEMTNRLGDVTGLLQIENLIDRMPKTLSGGQKQRVALARSIIRKPKIFLLDEPLSNLDAALREKTRTELKLLFSKIKGTVLYVTHDQVEAMTLSDRIILLNEGAVQQIGSPQEIYENPKNIFVASFVGTPAMNLIPGRVQTNLFYSGSFSLQLDACGIKTSFDSKDIILGIRSEHCEISTDPVDKAPRGVVRLLEPLGGQMLVTIDINGTLIKVMVKSVACAVGDSIWIVPSKKGVYLFDALSQARIYT